jgi:hypothetical protein
MSRYVVLDQITRNQLGEFPTVEEAEACLLRFVDAAPSAAEHLEIWDDELDVRLQIDPATLRPAPAA